MFRLALSRPSRVVLSSIPRWSSRYNSTIPPKPSVPENSTFAGPSLEKTDDVVKTVKTAAEEVDEELQAMSLQDDPTLAELERELSALAAEEELSTLKTPEKIGETESELFAATSRQSSSDPSTTSQPQAPTPQDAPDHDLYLRKNFPIRQTLDPSQRAFTETEYAATLVHGRSIHAPFYHPRTHDVPVASVQFRSHHPRLLDLFTHFAAHAASALGIPISRTVPLPTQRSLWTVPRSPFAHKKSQENFERRVHRRAIKAWDAHPDVVDKWCRYLRRHALGGVGMRVTTWERLPLGVGKERLARVMDQLGQGPSTADQTSAEKIRLLGQKIVVEELTALQNAAAVESPDVAKQ